MFSAEVCAALIMLTVHPGGTITIDLPVVYWCNRSKEYSPPALSRVGFGGIGACLSGRPRILAQSQMA